MGKWHYPKWKRIAMQAVLCMVFASSLALAQWMVHDRLTNGVTRLDAIEFFGPIGIRRPQGWSLKSPSLNAPIRVTLDEPPTETRSGRRLSITAERVTPGISAGTYLGPSKINSADNRPESIKIGTVNGILISMRSQDGFFAVLDTAPTESEYQLIACGVDPDGMAISIVLKCAVPSDADVETQQQLLQQNKSLVRDIARGIVVQPDPARR